MYLKLLNTILLTCCINVLASTRPESGIIEYETSLSGLGTNETGTKTEWFSGNKSATLEKSVKQINMFGIKKNERVEQLSILNGDDWYTLNLIEKTGTKANVKALRSMGTAIASNVAINLPTNLKEFVEENNGKWLPAETVLGRKCDVYELMQVKSWVYRGIVLRLESSMGGIISKQRATKFEEDVAVPEKQFKVPPGIEIETQELPPEIGSQGMFNVDSSSFKEDADENEPKSDYPLAKFKQAVSAVQIPGFRRMQEMSLNNDHSLILVGENEAAYNIMAHHISLGTKFEQMAGPAKYVFTHQGQHACFATTVDEEGVPMSFISVLYPKYNMCLLVTCIPTGDRKQLQAVLDQISVK